MSEQGPKDKQVNVPQDTEASGAESAELKAALARFASVFEKAVVPPAEEVDGGSGKPPH